MAQVLREVKADHLDKVWYKSYYISLRHSTIHTSRTVRYAVFTVCVQTADYDVIYVRVNGLL